MIASIVASYVAARKTLQQLTDKKKPIRRMPTKRESMPKTAQQLKKEQDRLDLNLKKDSFLDL